MSAQIDQLERTNPNQYPGSEYYPKLDDTQPTKGAVQRIAAINIDDLCDMFTKGMAQKEIAAHFKMDTGHLARWIASDRQRSARVREARTWSSKHWDEMAEQVIKDAADDSPGAIQKARELAQHYRWRASKLAPRDYGDKLDVTLSDDSQSLTIEQLQARLVSIHQRLLAAGVQIPALIEGTCSTVKEADPAD